MASANPPWRMAGNRTIGSVTCSLATSIADRTGPSVLVFGSRRGVIEYGPGHNLAGDRRVADLGMRCTAMAQGSPVSGNAWSPSRTAILSHGAALFDCGRQSAVLGRSTRSAGTSRDHGRRRCVQQRRRVVTCGRTSAGCHAGRHRSGRRERPGACPAALRGRLASPGHR